LRFNTWPNPSVERELYSSPNEGTKYRSRIVPGELLMARIKKEIDSGTLGFSALGFSDRRNATKPA